MRPFPGTATEKDVIEMDDRGGPLCELVDGTLVEKPMGVYESWLAARIIYFIGSYLKLNPIGIVTGPDGFYKLFPKIVRGPDVTFVRYERLPGGRVPRDPIPAVAPTLPIEVLSPSNTKREMDRKLREYFEAGAELVWYVDPETRSAAAYTAPNQRTEVSADGVLGGGAVLARLRVVAAGAVLAEPGARCLQRIAAPHRFSPQNRTPRHIRRKSLKSGTDSGRIYSSDGLFC